MNSKQKKAVRPTNSVKPCHGSGKEENNSNMKGFGGETLIQIIQTQNITIETQKITIDTLTSMLNDCGVYLEKLQMCSEKLQFLKVVR